jgi:hypothetical protein
VSWQRYHPLGLKNSIHPYGLTSWMHPYGLWSLLSLHRQRQALSRHGWLTVLLLGPPTLVFVLVAGDVHGVVAPS